MDEDQPIDLGKLEELLFGEHDETRHTYSATWIDLFWDEVVRGAVLARDLTEAVELAGENGPDGLQVNSIDGPDGQSWCLRGGHSVRQARVLIDTPTGLVDEEIPALTFEMAVDIAALLFGPGSVVLGVQDDTNLRWLEHPDEEFYDRPDLPAGWSWARPRP